MNEEQVTETSADAEDFTAETQEEQKFTQQDIDRIVKERLVRERNKILKQYEDVDVDRYRQLLQEQEAKEQEEQVKRGEFEKILKSTVEKKDAQLQQLQNELQSIKVDGSLLNAASANKAINPKQVVKLLKEQIRLTPTGEVEVVDDNGSVRYNDSGEAMTPEQLVKTFLNENPHFVSAGPSGAGTQSVVADSRGSVGAFDMNNLNMSNPEHRKLFKQHMKSKGIQV